MSSLERTFDYFLRALAPDLPEPRMEYQFAPPRKWRFDVAWPDLLCAIELDGGTFANGRHTRGAGYTADCWKLNAAVVRGWTVLRFTSDMLNSDPDGCIAQVRALLEREARP